MVVVLSVAAVALVAGACNKTDGVPSALGDAARRPLVPAEEPVRSHLVAYRPLLDEVSRAELDAGGLLIDLRGP